MIDIMCGFYMRVEKRRKHIPYDSAFFLYTFSTTRCFGVGKPWVGFMMMVCFIGPPIFMFFISEGFIHTSSRKRYGTRLLIFALITQIAFSITTTGGWGFSFKTFFFNWNVFFALFLGFIDLCIIESRQKPAVKVIGILATLLLSYFTNIRLVSGKTMLVFTLVTFATGYSYHFLIR